MVLSREIKIAKYLPQKKIDYFILEKTFNMKMLSAAP